MSELYIGLMSGTSMDGIDAALVDFSHAQPKLIATHYTPFPEPLRKKIHALCLDGDDEIVRLGELDVILGKEFANAVNAILKQQSLPPSMIKAIGSHGQTIRHMPEQPYRFTMQIGDPNIIAAETGITTIADFRRKDIALGGQGAPLVPAFHHHVFSSNTINRAIVNIGGIANVTILLKEKMGQIIGFDTGPGNMLMDAWIHTHQNESHDKDGMWSAEGVVQKDLLKQFMADDFFRLPPPKSTGRELFNLSWLNNHLQIHGNTISAVDVQATLVELTATSIIHAVHKYMPDGEILVCGGGAHNAHLMARLQALATPNMVVATTEKCGIHPDWVEAIAFAWLANQTLNRKAGNLPSVTGAKKPTILGGVYYS